jgi:dynein heavy chain
MLYDYSYWAKTREWIEWNDILPLFDHAVQKDIPSEERKTIKFHSLLVPTIDTARFSYLFQVLSRHRKHIFVRGTSGVGKSVIIQRAMKELHETGEFYIFPIFFSAHTTSPYTQEMLEGRLERKRGTAIQSPGGKKGVLFIDDINMPERDHYGFQPPIEFLRQLIEYGGLYERPSLACNDIRNISIIGACGPDGGGCNPLSPRILRYLCNLEITPPDHQTLRIIFESVLQPIFSTFPEGIRNQVLKVVLGLVCVYTWDWWLFGHIWKKLEAILCELKLHGDGYDPLSREFGTFSRQFVFSCPWWRMGFWHERYFIRRIGCFIFGFGLTRR